MRPFTVLSASLLAAAAIYGVPSALELMMLRLGASPWMVCVVFGDLIGCLILFLLGLRREAITLYLGCALVESCVIALGVMAPRSLALLTNLLPAAAVGFVMFRAGLRSLVANE